MNVTPVHRDHDELLIVRAAEGDADPVDSRLAQGQLTGCAECRALFADVAAIRASTTASVLRVPPRPRSFRVDPDELERSRLPAWRRWLSGLGSPRYDVLRPFAGAVAGVGLAVMVLSSVTFSFGSPAAAPIRDLAASAAASQGTSEVYAAPGASPVPAPGATAQSGRSTDYGPSTGGAAGAASPPALVSGSPDSAGPAASAPTAAEAPAAGSGKSVDSGSPSAHAPGSAGLPIGAVGAILLLTGVGVFLLQTTARRAARR